MNHWILSSSSTGRLGALWNCGVEWKGNHAAPRKVSSGWIRDERISRGLDAPPPKKGTGASTKETSPSNSVGGRMCHWWFSHAVVARWESSATASTQLDKIKNLHDSIRFGDLNPNCQSVVYHWSAQCECSQMRTWA